MYYICERERDYIHVSFARGREHERTTTSSSSTTPACDTTKAEENGTECLLRVCEHKRVRVFLLMTFFTSNAMHETLQ